MKTQRTKETTINRMYLKLLVFLMRLAGALRVLDMIRIIGIFGTSGGCCVDGFVDVQGGCFGYSSPINIIHTF